MKKSIFASMLFALLLFSIPPAQAQGAKIKWNTVADLTAPNAKPSAFFSDSTAIVLRLSVDSVTQSGTKVYLFQVYRFSDSIVYASTVDQVLQSAKQQQAQAISAETQIARQKREQKVVEDDADAEIKKRKPPTTMTSNTPETRQLFKTPEPEKPKPLRKPKN